MVAFTTQIKTRLPSNLRPTTREWVHLVTHGHFRSRDKDGAHTVRSENPLLHANPIAFCFIEVELWTLEVLHCRNRDFRHFCSCYLDLDRMTFIYELDPYSLRYHHHLFAKNTYNTQREEEQIAYGRCNKAKIQH